MHSRSRLLLMVTLLVVGTLALPWAASAQEPVTSRLKLSIGGYIKPEFVYRTAAGAVGLAGSVPGTQNFGFTAVPQANTLGHDNGLFSAIANETRFNFTLTAPDWRGLKPTGFIEFDSDGDTASTLERYCQGVVANGASPCFGAQSSGNPAGSVNNGGFRIRHAFFRLAGEGLGGNWEMTFGQTWGIFGMLPYYSGSSLSFGGATIFGQRQPQLSLRHTIRFFRDFAWETAIGAMSDTTNLNESPAGDISGRLIYRGWQGWQGGGRAPTSLGISARIQRQKADLYSGASVGVPICLGGGGSPTVLLGAGNIPASSQGCTVASGAGAALVSSFFSGAAAGAGSAANPSRSLSATAWGLSGGIFLPILPGTSATDRTWALSVVSEGGYGEGVNSLIPGASALPGAVTPGANERADAGAVFFNPGKCNVYAGPPGVNSLSLAAAAACNNGNPRIGSGTLMPTELSLIKTPWASWNVQFYLPWNFWLSGGQKWIWFPNADNAVSQTCINVGAACGSAASGTGLITPVSQGRFNPLTGQGAITAAAGVQNQTSGLFASRDSIVKRMSYNYVALFYDMTPNIRWGFEWGMHDTDRKDSGQDANSHRWQFGAYYFF